jgi:hypothetical protein
MLRQQKINTKVLAMTAKAENIGLYRMVGDRGCYAAICSQKSSSNLNHTTLLRITHTYMLCTVYRGPGYPAFSQCYQA